MLAQIGDVTYMPEGTNVLFHHIPYNFTPGMQFRQNNKKLHLQGTTFLGVYSLCLYP